MGRSHALLLILAVTMGASLAVAQDSPSASAAKAAQAAKQAEAAAAKAAEAAKQAQAAAVAAKQAAAQAAANAKPKPAAAAETKEGLFLRVRRKDGEPIALETALLRYVPKPGSKYAGMGVSIDLVGAVHVGEKTYYDQLNKIFTTYDATLYELVAPEGTRVPKGGGGGGGSPVSMLQRGMKDMLKLEFQLERVDYTAKNFVHADMSPAEFSRTMKERGESIWTMMFRMMGQSFAAQGAGAPSDIELLAALFSPDRALRLKQMMAQQMEQMEGMTKALNGPDGTNTIIGERNRKAFEVLRRELDGGKKRIAVFYGAGHLSDMETRLLRDFGMERKSVQWLRAWDLQR